MLLDDGCVSVWRRRCRLSGGLRRVLSALTLAGLCLLWTGLATIALSSIPTIARAQTGPELGWCTVVAAGTEECFAEPQAACAKQFQVYAGQGRLYQYVDTTYWNVKVCRWSKVLGEALPTSITFRCNTGYNLSALERCALPNELFPAADCGCNPNHGGWLNPKTRRPITLLDGAKTFTVSDFALAGGALEVGRTFTTRPGAAAGASLIALPLGFANWRFSLGMELQLGDAWTSSSIAGLATPDGGHYRFAKSGTAMVPTTSTDYPNANTDYELSFVGTWPGTLSAVLTSKSSWIVKGPDDRTWYLDTVLNRKTGAYDIARPVRVVEPDGLEYALEYASGVVDNITDSYGRKLAFQWEFSGEHPGAISRIFLPDGTTLEYSYEKVGAQALALPGRLVKVERKDGASVLDRTSYDYGASAYPTFVTGIRDKDGTLRWSVAYDTFGRATSSSGPSGTESYTVTYGSAGSTFTRTVTNPLGKSTVYTFSRTSTRYDLSLTSVVDQASPSSPAATASNGFDANKNLVSGSDKEGRVTGYTRDAKGRATQVVEAQGTTVARTSNLTWHAVRNAPTQVAGPGVTTDDTYAAGTSAGPFVPTYVAVANFAYSGAAQTYAVPSGVSSVIVDLWGGAGGNGNYISGNWSGAGGHLRATFAVAPGDILKLEVGGGGQGGVKAANGGAGGWPDGGGGGRGDTGNGGGGGSTRFYINDVLMAVAGGGGGGGGYSGSAGAGGGDAGQAAYATGGLAGTQSAGGADASDLTNANKTGRSILAFPGAQRTGGWGSSAGNSTTSSSDDGGGGGGGYWGGGGGGGDGASGGGGSSWIHSSALAGQTYVGFRQTPARAVEGLPALAAGVNSGTSSPAVAGGDGYATLKLK